MNEHFPKIQHHKPNETISENFTEHAHGCRSAIKIWFREAWEPYQKYFEQPILFASLSYVLLYLTVLAPGALIINYLTYKGVGPLEISAFQAASACVGVVGTFFGPYIISKLGLAKAGIITIWSQTIIVACVIFQLFIFTEINLWFLLVPIILSRAPLWIFDIIEVQILQESIPEADRGKVNGAEYSLTCFMTLMSYVIGLIAGTPDKFSILALVSISCVLTGAIFFTIWFLKHGRKTHERN